MTAEREVVFSIPLVHAIRIECLLVTCTKVLDEMPVVFVGQGERITEDGPEVRGWTDLQKQWRHMAINPQTVITVKEQS